jgi:hypothetical protein
VDQRGGASFSKAAKASLLLSFFTTHTLILVRPLGGPPAAAGPPIGAVPVPVAARPIGADDVDVRTLGLLAAIVAVAAAYVAAIW